MEKRSEPITSLTKNEKLTVQKSLPLFSLWKSELTLSEFKILDVYLSRIDSHNPDRRVVVFEKGELEHILGVQKINNKDLEQRLTHLMGNVVKIEDKTIKKGFGLVTLFEEAVAEPEENGLWNVRLECTQKAMKYFFNVENLGYLRYKLRSITSLTSRYSYILFTYLEHNRFRKSWEIDLEELKITLNCEKEETYKEFKRFNDRLLKRVQKELHEKTECRYAYEPVKKGRKVTAIRFTLQTLTDQYNIGEQLPLEEFSPADETTESLLHVACNHEFTDAEMEVIDAILRSKNLEVGQYGIEVAKYHYLERIYREFIVYAARCEKNGEPIKNRYRYFTVMLQNS